MVGIETFIEETNNCSDPAEVFKLYEQALAAQGYDRVVYSLMTDHPSMNKHAGHGLQRNYPEDWMKHYVEHDYFHIDPVPKQAFQTAFPFTWESLMKQGKLSPQETFVMRQAEEAELYDGIGIPIYGPNSEVAGVGMASSTKGINPDPTMLCTLRALTFQFHFAYSSKMPPKEESDSQLLTEREVEVLLWLAEGKSKWEIGKILDLSENTIRFHIKNIFQKLDVSDKTMAVIKAIRFGILNPARIKVI